MNEQLKLDILKLVHRFDKHPNDVIAHAKIYEGYVSGETAVEIKEEVKTPEKKKGFFNKKDDNL